MTTGPDGVYSAEQLHLVQRQIAVWEGRDVKGARLEGGGAASGSSDTDGTAGGNEEVAALADWDPAGVLIAPRGVRLEAAELPAAIARWRHDFTDLHIELTTLVSSEDEKWLMIEWTWHVTRRSDLARSSTPDAIIVAMANGRIVRWREYFDTHGSVEFS